MKNKKIIIIIIVGIISVAILTAIVIWQWPKFSTPAGNKTDLNAGQLAKPYEPQFMDSAEKAQFGIPDELKIQVLVRGDKGEPAVYRIIKDDSQIVTDPTQLKTVSPRQK